MPKYSYGKDSKGKNIEKTSSYNPFNDNLVNGLEDKEQQTNPDQFIIKEVIKEQEIQTEFSEEGLKQYIDMLNKEIKKDKKEGIIKKKSHSKDKEGKSSEKRKKS